MRKMLAFLACLALPAQGEVEEVDDLGFVSQHEIDIGAPPARVFEALTEEIGGWWDSAHTHSGDALGLTLDERCLCESLPDAGFVVHLQVDFWRPGKTLRLSGGLGPLQALGVAGSMTFAFTATEAGTRLSYRYAVSGRGAGAWAEPVDRVQLGQLERLARYVETGSPAAEQAGEKAG